MAGPDFQVGQSFVANEPFKVKDFTPSGAMAIAGAIDEGANQLDLAARFYQEDQKRLGKFNALTALDNAQTEAAQRLEQMKLEAKPGAANFTQEFKAERAKIFDKARQTFPDAIKPELDYQAAQMENNLAQQAFSTEMKTRDQYYKTTLDNKMSDKLNSIDANPDNFWAAEKTAIQMIDAAGITTTDKEHYLRTWKANSQTALFNKIKETDPENAVVALGGKVKITNPDKLFIMNAIRKEANETGLTDYMDVAVAVAAQESDFKVDAGNATTGVRGIFQLDANSRAKYGYTPDLKGNISSGLADMRERILTFKKDFGRYPTPNEYYVYHYQGIGGGKAILKADPNASMWQTLADSQSPAYADKVFKQNPWLNPNSTNAQYIAWSAQKVNNKLYQTGGKYDANMDVADPTYKDIPYDKRIQLRNSAESEFKAKEDTDYRISHNLEQETRDRTFNDAVTLFREDKLTTQYVDQHAAELGPQNALHLDNLLKAEDKATNYSPDVHSDLLSRSWQITNPADAQDLIKDAMQARADKAISKEDYSVIQGLVNKAQSDGVARKDLVNINSEAIKANFLARTTDPAYVTKAKAGALGDVDYRKWAMDNPNATTEDHSKKVAEIIKGAKLESVGLTPSTSLRTIVPIMGDRTPTNSSEADLYGAMSKLTEGKVALLAKQRAASNNDERADLARKVLSLNTQQQRIKDILDWKGAPFDATKLDEFNKPTTTDKPATVKTEGTPGAAKKSGLPATPSRTAAEGGEILSALNYPSLGSATSQQAYDATLEAEHQKRIYDDPDYASRIIREEVEQKYFVEEYTRLQKEYDEVAKTDKYAAEPLSRLVATRNNKVAAEKFAKANAAEKLNDNADYQREVRIARGAKEAYSAAYQAEKAREDAVRESSNFYIAWQPSLDRRFRQAGKRAKRDYILSERQK